MSCFCIISSAPGGESHQTNVRTLLEAVGRLRPERSFPMVWRLVEASWADADMVSPVVDFPLKGEHFYRDGCRSGTSICGSHMWWVASQHFQRFIVFLRLCGGSLCRTRRQVCSETGLRCQGGGMQIYQLFISRRVSGNHNQMYVFSVYKGYSTQIRSMKVWTKSHDHYRGEQACA